MLSGAFRDTDNGTIRLDASVVRATTAEVRATGTASDRLEQLFGMEKELLFDLLDRMAVPLTPAERSALAERPTADIQSFLAFSRGLDAEDRGTSARRRHSSTRPRQGIHRSPRPGSAPRGTPASGLPVAVTAARLSAVAERPGKSVRGAQLAAALQNIAPSMAGRLNRANRPAAIRSRLAEALRQDDASRIGITSLGVTVIPRP